MMQTDPPITIPDTMRAVVRDRYGNTSTLRVDDVAVPTPKEHGVLVEVHASTVNPADRYTMLGTPWLIRVGPMGKGLRRPKHPGLGMDLAGRVVAVGTEVSTFAPGDEVVGIGESTYAGYAMASADTLAKKPANASWHEAAGIGVASITALQGLRDVGGVEAGQKVLINGASGGVGTAAVQIARWMGAEVTAVCSTRNVDLVRELGADHVVDYTQADFTDTDERYDVIFDNQGNQPLGRLKRLLVPGGMYVVVGGKATSKLAGPMMRMLGAVIRFIPGDRQAKLFIAEEKTADLEVLADLMRFGDLRTVIDSVYPFDGVADAIDLLGTGRARGKIIIDTRA